MTRPRRGQPRAETKILTAARKLFARRGYSETSMAEIARAAGVARATVYNNFDDKQDILAAIISEYMAGYGQIAQRLRFNARRGQTSFELIQEMVREALAWRVKNADLRPIVAVARNLRGSGWEEANSAADEAMLGWILAVHAADYAAGLIRKDIDLEFGVRAAYAMIESILSTFDVSADKGQIDHAAHQLALLHWHAVCSADPSEAPQSPLGRQRATPELVLDTASKFGKVGVVKLGILGAGAEGSGLSALLAAEEGIETILLGDVDAARLQLAEQRFYSLSTEVELVASVVDAAEADQVSAWAKEADAVLNATLPHLNLSVMRGCLAAGAHYMDLNSGPFEVPGLIPYSDTIDAQFELDNEFAEASLTAVSCAGVAPGWVDLAAHSAVDQMDTVDSITVRWVEWNDGRELISTVGPNLIPYFNMPTPMRWEAGEVVEVDLFDSEELYEWPSLGPIPVFTGFMHPEMRTMHNLGVDLNRVEVKSGLSNGRWKTSKDIWIEAIRRGLADSSDGATGDIADVIGRAFIPPERYDEALEQGVVSEGVFAVCVQVVGTRGAQRADHTIGLMASLRDARAAIPWGTHMVYATSGSTPIVLLPMLGRGEISRTGVIGVGALPEWREVLAAVKQRGHRTWERVQLS